MVERIKDMSEQDRHNMYREKRQITDNLSWKSDNDLVKEFTEAQHKIKNNPTWGAAVSALLEWKHNLEREIVRRGLTIG